MMKTPRKRLENEFREVGSARAKNRVRTEVAGKEISFPGGAVRKANTPVRKKAVETKLCSW
jgi:hypothetical protein